MLENSLMEFPNEFDRVRQSFHEKATKLFKRWIKESGIDVEENLNTANEYRKEIKCVENLEKTVKKKKLTKNVAIVFSVIGYVLGFLSLIILIYSNNKRETVVISSILMSVGFVLGVTLTVYICKKLNFELLNLDEVTRQAKERAKNLLSKCYTQLAPLYKLYKDSATTELIQEVIPIVKLDKCFDVKRFELLKEKYGFDENLAQNESTIGIFSGEILGNPFVEEKKIRQSWVDKTYTGTLTIYWTTYHRDKNGNLYSKNHSQILVASVTKPMPHYDTLTRFVYANEAAPNLKFTHLASHAERLSENEINKLVEKNAKKLVKLEKKALADGKDFTSMGNLEFETLFNAIDRNNEVEFRLLFTPLAQKNMLHLLKNKPYGDDFNMIKDKNLNYVLSAHAQKWDFNIDVRRYKKYDAKMCLSEFLKYNETFLKNFYFELAPIMSIPLYQQHKPMEYIYKHNYYRNNTSFEAEVLANAINKSTISHSESVTDTIVKTSLIDKLSEEDKVLIEAHSFSTIERIDYVPQLGGDGCIHNVPVHWLEYIPISKETVASIKDLKKDVNNKHGDIEAIMHNLHIKLIN